MVPKKYEGKYGERKSRGKVKGKKKQMKIKIDLKSINYFYMLFQTRLTYFSFSMERSNNLKIYKFLTNFNYILFSFHISHIETKYKKIIFLSAFFLLELLS